jgi:chromosome segregation ATPase
LVGLLERLREELVVIQGQCEAWAEELEVKRRALRVAEATLGLLERRAKEASSSQEEEAAWGVGVPGAQNEDVSQLPQASVSL